MSEFDMKITCVDCGREFDFPVEEQRYFMRNGYSMPKRCRECRNANDAKMPAAAMAAALEAQKKAALARNIVEPVETPLAPREPEVEQMAEPINPAAPVQPVREIEPQPAVQPVAKEQPAVQPAREYTPQPAPQPEPQVEYAYYLLVDGNKYVSIDNEKKMVNIRADMKDLFDSYDEAKEWKEFLADKGVIAMIKETTR